MANHTPLTHWLFKCRGIFNPRFVQLDWPKRLLPEVHDFQVTLTWNGMTAEGRGLDAAQEIALEKAVAEALERLICLGNKIGSVGTAVSGFQDPRPHALNEAIERYALNFHLEHRLPLSDVPVPSNSLVKSFLQLNPNVRVRFFELAMPTGSPGSVCMIEGSKISFGFSVSLEMESAASRAFLEAIPNFAWLESFDGDNSQIAWHLRDDFVNKLVPLLGRKPSERISLPKFLETSVDLNFIPEVANSPIRFARYITERIA